MHVSVENISIADQSRCYRDDGDDEIVHEHPMHYWNRWVNATGDAQVKKIVQIESHLCVEYDENESKRNKLTIA